MEPLAPNRILPAVIAAALILLLGAAYAGLYALAKLRRDRRLHLLALAAYAGLAAAVAGLSVSLQLAGAWRILVPLLLMGYLIAPRAVWHLCTRIDGTEDR